MILKAACMCQAGSLVWQMSEFWGLYWNSQVKNVSHWEVRLWGALMWCDVFHKLCFPVLTMNSITLLLPVFTKLQTTGKQDLGKGYWTVLRDQWNKDTHPYTQTYTLSRAHTHRDGHPHCSFNGVVVKLKTHISSYSAAIAGSTGDSCGPLRCHWIELVQWGRCNIF